jgi:hypothetical protein
MSRLPPNQRLTTDFPFLHFGKVPEIDQLFKQNSFFQLILIIQKSLNIQNTYLSAG